MKGRMTASTLYKELMRLKTRALSFQRDLLPEKQQF